MLDGQTDRRIDAQRVQVKREQQTKLRSARRPVQPLPLSRPRA